MLKVGTFEVTHSITGYRKLGRLARELARLQGLPVTDVALLSGVGLPTVQRFFEGAYYKKGDYLPGPAMRTVHQVFITLGYKVRVSE